MGWRVAPCPLCTLLTLLYTAHRCTAPSPFVPPLSRSQTLCRFRPPPAAPSPPRPPPSLFKNRRNQARGEPKAQRRFINDTIRNDFHRRFLERYIK